MASHAGGEAYGLISLVVSFAMEVLEELETNVIHTAGIPTLLAHPEYQSLERAEPLMNFLSEMGRGGQPAGGAGRKRKNSHWPGERGRRVERIQRDHGQL